MGNDSERLALRRELKLTEEQKKRILSLLPQVNELNRKLSVINWCISALSINVWFDTFRYVQTNLLLLPVIDKGNELFTSSFTSSQVIAFSIDFM